MNINLTLIGQTITFAVFVWFCMKFVWPPIMNALEERKTRIADGLAAAEEGKRAKADAEARAEEVLGEARGRAAEIIAGAETRGAEIVEAAKTEARTEGERLIQSAQAEVAQQTNRAREKLRAEVAALAATGAAQILRREVDAGVHEEMLGELAGRL
ncbi:MAG: F0F1 ATP synthase subunit B [Gammaproteobacteria bacterium]|nr:F0F1 ATP synthase subunit B [Gammaproteobacteria bacterium]MDD9870378.1 F0F1 ATP synthase subunit B [Gammaproteobacteria bacterium]